MNINIVSGGVSVLARDVVAGSGQLTAMLGERLGIEYDEAEAIKLGRRPVPDGESEQVAEIFLTTCSEWVLEVKKAIDLYLSRNPEESPSLLVLSGGGSKVRGLREFVARETGLEVLRFNPFAGMEADGKRLDPDYVAAAAPEMTIAVGLALRESPF